MSAGERPQLRIGMSAAEERAADFGTFLRRAREQRGLTLQQLAVSTKISARALEALEHNDPRKLPGGIFSRAFVRAYAREVGLDPEAAVAKFIAAFPDDSGATEIPSSASEEVEGGEPSRRTAATAVKIVGAAAVIVALGLATWAWWQRSGQAGNPARDQAPAAMDRSLGAQAPASGDALPDVPPAPALGAAAAAEAGGAVPPPATGEIAVAPQAQAPRGAPLVVGLTAEGDCWLSVTVDGTTLPQRTLVTGEQAEFQVWKVVSLRIGNAGAVAMTLNGAPAKTLGRVGEVVTATIPADAFSGFLR